MQTTIALPENGHVGVVGPWTEYIKMLPADGAPLPTLWTDEERVMLTGTSLEVRREFPLEAFGENRKKENERPLAYPTSLE